MQAEPNWKEMYTWAHNMARKMVPNNYWTDELASAAVSRLCEVWERYSHLNNADWRKVISNILYKTMLKALVDEKTKGTRFSSFDTEDDGDTTEEHAFRDTLQGKQLDYQINDSQMKEVEDLADLEYAWKGFNEYLTDSESRVLRERFQNPGATSNEIAEWAKVNSGGAVRLHETHIRHKAKSFINSNHNKMGSKCI